MAGGMTDAHLPGMQSGFPISLGAANPKSVPKSVPETLERPVITLDEVQAIRAEQKRLGHRCEEIREAVGELLASKNGAKDESYAQALEKRVDLVVDELSGAFQMLQELRLAFESRPACVIESESPTDPDDDFEAAREFEDQAKRFARRCPHLFRAACSRVMAVASGW